MTKPLVLVTGGAGFIAGHCILALLDQGYSVRTTVRSLDREASVRAILAAAGNTHDDALGFVVADLTDDAGWAEAVAGCEYVLHVASPIPHGEPRNEDDVILPAREGTLRVLRAARDGGVKRLVMTSSFGAVSYGYGRTDHVFTEADWTKLDGPGVGVYDKSKTLAERAAWQFIEREGGSLELTTIEPVAVFGPILGTSVSGGNDVVRRILNGQIPGYPDFWFPVVDVRDVALGHALAMTAEGAAGQRFILYSGEDLSMKQVGDALRAHVGSGALGGRAGAGGVGGTAGTAAAFGTTATLGAKIPTRTIPSFVVRLAALFVPEMRQIAPQLGIIKKIDGSKARTILGWTPRPAVEAIVATGDSMIRAGLVTG